MSSLEKMSRKCPQLQVSSLTHGPLVRVWDAQGMRGSSFLLKTEAQRLPPPKSVFHYRQEQPRFITAGWLQAPPLLQPLSSSSSTVEVGGTQLYIHPRKPHRHLLSQYCRIKRWMIVYDACNICWYTLSHTHTCNSCTSPFVSNISPNHDLNFYLNFDLELSPYLN